MKKKIEKIFNGISLGQIFQTIPSGLFLVDTDKRILYWNPEAERITGYLASEAVGKHCSFLEGIPCGSDCGCSLFEKPDSEPVIGAFCSIKTRQGDRVKLLKNMDFLRNEAGNIIGGVESFIDITELKHLEEQLRQQTFELEHKVRQRTAELEKERSQLRTVFDTIDDFVYIVSEGYRIEFMNRVMVETFGDHIGGTCYQVLYNRSSPCEGCPMPLVLRNQTLRDERFIPKTDRTYEIIHTPLKTAKGKFQKLATYRDITVRKLAEEKLLESNRELDAFVYTVSHDLRNPLTAVIGYADLMMEEYREQLDEQGLGMLKEIEAQGTRMSDLLEDLLDLARVGHIESPAEIVEVKEVVRNILIDHSESIKVKQITVEVTALPTLIIPATFLSQIFSNLIENAIRYAGKPGTSIEIGSERGSGQVRLYVRDHGPGIPEEERSRVFEVFFRGSAGQNLSGTGIGLATVRKIVQLYNGRVWVEETPRGGSTFWMEFPN